MNTDPRFKIGDRVKLRYAYDEATDSFYPTDDGDEGVIYGVAWNNSDRWHREAAWVYWIRIDRHSQPWLPCPFWNPDPIPGDELRKARLPEHSRATVTVADSTLHSIRMPRRGGSEKEGATTQT